MAAARWAALAIGLATAGCRHAPAAEPGVVAAAEAPAAVNPVIDPKLANPSILVMPLRAEAGLTASATALDEMILSAISRYRRYQVLGPEDINALLGVDKMKDAVGCDDVSCAAQLGGALGAPFLVAGQLRRLDNEAVLSLRLLDTKASKVLSRGTARGGTDADALSAMMAQAVGELFGIAVDEVKRIRDTAAPAPAANAPPANYADYSNMIASLTRRLSNGQYTQLLEDIEGFQAKRVVAPPGYSSDELLIYYRVVACFQLKRAPCLQKAAEHYLSRWPEGSYAQAVQTYLEQQDTTVAQQGERSEELEEQLRDLRAKRDAGQITDDEMLELSAYAATGALAYRRAADMFAELMDQTSDDERWFTFVQQRAFALEQLGEFGQARAVLTEAQQRNRGMFRAHGLNQILKRLPR